jgi:hypothetical protein
VRVSVGQAQQRMPVLQIVPARLCLLRSHRHCPSPSPLRRSRSRSPQTACPAPAPGLDPVVVKAAAARRMRVVVGRQAARVVTVAVVCRFDRIVPGSVKELLCSVGSMLPVRLHSASYYAAAFPIPIGDSGAPEDRDSANRAVVVDSPDRLIPEGGCHVMLVASVVAVAAVVVRELAHHRVRESRLL